MLKGLAVGVAGTVLLASAAHADVTAKAPDGFTIRIVAEAPVDRDAAWARLVDIASWWSESHTYSGKASSLSLNAEAGGCWCEMWDGGEVEHGRVVSVMPRQLLRLDAPLGPLQEMGVEAALTFELADGAKPSTTKITVNYKVSGSSLSALDQVAAGVNGVLAEQITRLAAGK